ncbi:MAG TPA: amidohydrolase family protein [Haliangium sp.]|nr:amidohydrolase family protein [Haliangium sp.]
MRDSHRIIDADRHVIEPIAMWKEYLEPAFREHAPHFEPEAVREPLVDRVVRLGERGLVPLPPRLMTRGEPVVAPLTERARIELAIVAHQRAAQTAAGEDPRAHLAVMDKEGIDVGFFYPTWASFLLGVDTMAPPTAAAFARAYNDWLGDFCSVDPHRLRAVGLISRHDPEDMVTELRRIAHFGWTAVVLRPNPVKGRILSHPDYEPFWAECERLSIAVSIHEGAHSRLPTTGADRFTSRFAQHACSHPFEQMMALLALIEGGVLERHPGLRVAFLEAGVGWLPYWLWRLDEVEYAHLAGEVQGNVCMKPSEYFRRQCFVSIEPDEPYLPEVLPFIGEDHLLLGSDFPHFDHDLDIVHKVLGLGTRLPDGALEKLLWRNAERFYRADRPGRLAD